MKMEIGILQKGDDVLNVWSSDPSVLKVAVKNKKGEVHIYSVAIDEQNIPRLEKNNTLILTYGDGMVTTEIPAEKLDKSKEGDEQTNSSANNSIKIQTF